MYSRNKTKSRMKKLFASVDTVVSKDGNVERWSVTNSATRESTIDCAIGASTGAKSGTRDSPRSELSHEAWRDSTAARPAAVGKYSWVWVTLSSAPWYSPEPVFSNAEAVSRKACRFGIVRRARLKCGGRRIGTGRGLSGSSR